MCSSVTLNVRVILTVWFYNFLSALIELSKLSLIEDLLCAGCHAGCFILMAQLALPSAVKDRHFTHEGVQLGLCLGLPSSSLL